MGESILYSIELKNMTPTYMYVIIVEIIRTNNRDMTGMVALPSSID